MVQTQKIKSLVCCDPGIPEDEANKWVKEKLENLVPYMIIYLLTLLMLGGRTVPTKVQ